MADIIEGGRPGSSPLRVVIGAASREMRTALFLSIDSGNIKLVATAATVSELVTHARTFLPDALIVADDLLVAADPAASIGKIREKTSCERIFVLGPSAWVIAETNGVTILEDSSDLLDALLACRVSSRPAVAGPA